MKIMSKIISMCALLIAVSACYGGAKEMFYVKNETSLPVYVGLYIVTKNGNVTNNTQKAFMLEPAQHALFSPQKSLIPGRTQGFIFSASLNQLAHTVVKNAPSEYVFSRVVMPKIFSYKITGDLENMQLKELDASQKSGAKSTISYNLKKAFEKADKERKEQEQERKTAAALKTPTSRQDSTATRSSRGKIANLADATAEFHQTAQQVAAEQKRKAERSLTDTFKEDVLRRKPRTSANNSAGLTERLTDVPG